MHAAERRTCSATDAPRMTRGPRRAARCCVFRVRSGQALVSFGRGWELGGSPEPGERLVAVAKDVADDAVVLDLQHDLVACLREGITTVN